MGTVRIFIVEDHPMVREGLREFLSMREDFDIVGMADNLADAEKQVRAMRPDVVLLDIKLGNANGLALVKRLRGPDSRQPKFVVVTSYDDNESISRAMNEHVDGYLHKDTSAGHLIEAIEAVVAGKNYMSPEVGGKLLENNLGLPGGIRMGLTESDLDLLRCIAEGDTNAELAEKFAMSTSTVKRRINVIFDKMGVANRAQAVSGAYRMGIL